MELRPYQEKAIKEILESFETKNSIMLQMPTGTGKTNVFAEIVRRWIKEIAPNKRLLVMVHRKELVDQIIERLLQFGVYAGRIQAGHVSNYTLRVQVGMVQSLRKPQSLPHNLSLIIIDEAHHSPAVSYQNIINHYGENVKLLGVTATPCRTNGEGFSNLFTKLIVSEPIKSFINQGYLSSIKHLATSIPDLSKVRFNNRTKDYNERDLEIVVRNERIMADLIESYLKYAKNKKCIVFALNRAHSRDIVSRFNEKGVPANYIDSNTSKAERAQIVADFKAGIYKVLSNVNIFTEGFDCPDVEVVQLARPTKSFILYLQQVGRVMRPFENKPFGLILDNACLWKEHGLVTQHINWTLDGGVTIEREKVFEDENNEIQVETANNLIKEKKGLELVEIDEVLIAQEDTKLSINEICFLLKKDTQLRQFINILSFYKYGNHEIRIQDLSLFEENKIPNERLLSHLLDTTIEESNSIKFSKVSDFLLTYYKDLNEKEVNNRNINFGLYNILKAIEFNKINRLQKEKIMEFFIAQGFSEDHYQTFKIKYFRSEETLLKLITSINTWHHKHLESICKKLNVTKPEIQIDPRIATQFFSSFTDKIKNEIVIQTKGNDIISESVIIVYKAIKDETGNYPYRGNKLPLHLPSTYVEVQDLCNEVGDESLLKNMGLLVYNNIKRIEFEEGYKFLNTETHTTFPEYFIDEIDNPDILGRSIIKKGTFFGVIDLIKDNELLPPKFEKIETTLHSDFDNLFITSLNGKKGVYNDLGIEKIAMDNDDVLFDEKILIKNHQTWRIYDKELNEVTKEQLTIKKEFTHFSFFEYNSKIGICTPEKKIVLPNFFDKVSRLNETNSIVKLADNLYGLIQKTNQIQWLLEPNYTEIKRLDINYLLVKKDNLFGITDWNGLKKLECIYKNCELFENGFLARQEHAWQYILNNKILFEHKSKDAIINWYNKFKRNKSINQILTLDNQSKLKQLAKEFELLSDNSITGFCRINKVVNELRISLVQIVSCLIEVGCEAEFKANWKITKAQYLFLKRAHELDLI